MIVVAILPEGPVVDTGDSPTYSIYCSDEVFVILGAPGRSDVAVCHIDSQIEEVPANGDSALVEPLTGAVAKVEEGVDSDHIRIASIILRTIAPVRPCVLSGTIVCEEESFKIVVSTNLNCNQADSYQ